MAFGRDNERDKVDAEAMRRRRAKQRGYQERYRKRLIVDGVPEQDSIAHSCLMAFIEVWARGGEFPEALKPSGFWPKMLDNLERRGANREAAKAAVLRMVNRFRDADGREKREVDLDAAYQAKLKRETA